jgi:hypothetical protein
MPLRRLPLGLFPNQTDLVGQSETRHVERRREGGVDFQGSFQLILDLRMSVPVEILVEALTFEEILRSPSKNGAGTQPSAGAAPMKTTVVRAAAALAPALALWLASAEASTRAYAWGWQSAVAEPLMSWAAGSARRRWRSRAPFAPGSP